MDRGQPMSAAPRRFCRRRLDRCTTNILVVGYHCRDVRHSPRLNGFTWGSRPRLPSKSSMTFYRRRLPHLQRDSKPHFITFTTYDRWILPPTARDITLECCKYIHQKSALLHVAVVMPDHVHLILSPLVDEEQMKITPLARIMSSIKSVSARRINRGADAELRSCVARRIV